MRLIDANELERRLLFSPVVHDSVNEDGLYNVIAELDNTPTVDPVKHGHWIVDEDGNVKCSECGNGHSNDKYCECCGAKMDEEG